MRQVLSLGWEDPLTKEMTTHSNILAWRTPWTEEPGGLLSMESQRVGHDLAIKQLPVKPIKDPGAAFLLQLILFLFAPGHSHAYIGCAWVQDMWFFSNVNTSLVPLAGKKKKKTHAKWTGLETVVVMLHVPSLDRKETMEDLRVTERLGHRCFCLAIKTRFKSCEAIYFFELLLHFIMVGYMYRQKEYCKVC